MIYRIPAERSNRPLLPAGRFGRMGAFGIV